MKKLIASVLALVCVLGMIGCNNRSINYIIENKPSVTGTVEEVHDDYIIVYSEKADGYPNGSNWSISLNVENKDSYTDVVVGDEIVFYYDGIAMETDPLQVSTVYAITLKTPDDRTVNETIEKTDVESSKEEVVVGGDLIPMVMVNGEIYMDTGHESTVEARCGMMDGEITSEVDRSEKPIKDNESNFGIGYGYQYGSHEGTIEIYMNDKWWVFATEKVMASSELIIEPVATEPNDELPDEEAFVVTNVFTAESKSLLADDGLTIADILGSDSWNTEGTTDGMSNIEITINGETYK
ncbi:MAG: hypothetical protein ACI4DN_05930 [Lachnospiraceae bacterium]